MRNKMKRFLGILLSLVLILGLMPGMGLTANAAGTIEKTVTWTSFTGSGSMSSDGVTLTCQNRIPNARIGGAFFSGRGGFTFSSEGTIKKIVITGSPGTAPSGWTQSGNDYIWTGSSSTVTADFQKYDVSKIVFTIEIVPVTGVNLNKTETTLTAGGTQTLTATVAPDNATNKSVTWTSSNNNIATVSNGMVTAKAVGNATITVTTNDGGKTATCNVTVEKGAGNISYGTASVNKSYGDAAFTNTLTNTGDGTVTYASDDSDVATVDGSTGVVTIVGVGDGSATITATVQDSNNYTYDNKTASYTITVAKADPETPTSLTATYGQTLADVPLPEGWAWADSTTSVGNAGTNSFTANYTAASANYNFKSDVDVSVTVSKANAVPATVTANNRTYDGTEKTLVTVTGEATGGTMQYALGTATEATEPDTTSIPTATAVGTYYVWYKVVGDENHSDTTPACVIAKIDKGNPSANILEKETIKYSGEPQELVTPGTVENGTMMYALGSDDKTAPKKEEFRTSIPTGTSVGTYYVWYYAKGDAGYEDTTPVCVVVTIYELRADAEIDKSKLPDGKNTSVAGDIPIPEGLLSEAQKANNGNEKVELKLVVAPKGEEKAAESETLQKDAQMSNSVKIQYKDENSVSVEVLEIDIEKYINYAKADNVIETSKVLEIAIPYNFEGKYDPRVLRRHGDGVHVFTALSERPTGEPKDGTFFADRDNHILYIYANLFSTYVVAYSTVEGNARVVSAGSSSSQVDYPKTIPVYRLYNKYKGAHLLTTNNEERDILLGEKATEGWIDEGIAFNVAVNSSAPVYRVFDLKNGIHFYTTDAATRDTYVANGCRDEGIAWYAALKPGRTVYKVSNPSNGRILYTISKPEADALTNSGYTCQEAEFVVY